ncbi:MULTISPECIES: MFS transporter [unclassified Pseudomonas]|uniref:MFS transporter n=1 Tax=unclassified Pseudomonas TaxID=196821 RepID=UPI002AC96DA7|nr:MULTISPECIES: MFS transporter [unclassified Pseudomonas]MEB0040693.1 MFS transporter [Pseudomonas sp. MH10]MEB0078592.1 MFS transporter [Pseudomonas sp. MH10out]MEB0091634.1 MFS transporter [Pseudomonas sp. CCI4.2]MEB0099963.1 MFS transporter [Pseudomonas sp. CCI3.2]MEB0123079.1 MFS transporter [Pseudomonas sp. CCI1.2]
MSKSVTFNRGRPLRAGAIIWQVAQTLWVGGLVLLHLAMLTVLDQAGLAPLLIDEVANLSGALLVGFAAFCAALQMIVLVQVERLSSLWLDVRGQLLVIATLASASHYVLYRWLPDAVRWQLLSYLVLALSGLLLVIQPIPGESGRAHNARP